MSHLHIREYSQLKKVVSSYIDTHPIPTRLDNDRNLKELGRLKHENDPATTTARKKLRDKIILCNGGFGMKYVLNYYNLLNDDQAIGELFQESIIGIAEAIDAFDVTMETSFTTYAYFHIKKRLIDFIKKNKIVRAPREIAKNLKLVSEVIDKITSEDHRKPTSLEIKKYIKKNYKIDIEESTVENVSLLLDLNSQANDNTFIVEYSEQSSNQPETSVVTLMKSNIEADIANLPELEQKQIRLRFGLDGSPHSFDEIEVILENYDME